MNLAVGYGQFNAGNSVDWDDSGHKQMHWGNLDEETVGKNVNMLKDTDVFYAKADADFGAFELYANYISNQETGDVGGWDSPDFDIWGVGVNVPVGDSRIFGEYWQNTANNSVYTTAKKKDKTMDVEDTAWNVGVGYGKRDLKKVGSWQLDVAYNDVGAGMYFGGTGLQTDILDGLWGAKDFNDNWQNGKWIYDGASEIKFWNAIAEVTVMQNMYVHAEYAFAADADQGEDPDDTWTVSLNYVF